MWARIRFGASPVGALKPVSYQFLVCVSNFPWNHVVTYVHSLLISQILAYTLKRVVNDKNNARFVVFATKSRRFCLLSPKPPSTSSVSRSNVVVKSWKRISESQWYKSGSLKKTKKQTCLAFFWWNSFFCHPEISSQHQKVVITHSHWPMRSGGENIVGTDTLSHLIYLALRFFLALSLNSRLQLLTHSLVSTDDGFSKIIIIMRLL